MNSKHRLDTINGLSEVRRKDTITLYKSGHGFYWRGKTPPNHGLACTENKSIAGTVSKVHRYSERRAGSHNTSPTII